MDRLFNFQRILLISLTLSACAPVAKSAHTVAEQSLSSVGCKTFQSEMWSSLQKIADQNQSYPTPKALNQALIDLGSTRGLSGPKFEHFVKTFLKTYDQITSGITQKFDPQTQGDWKKALSELEVGVRTTEIHAEVQDQLQKSLVELSLAEKDLGVSCEAPPSPTTPPAQAPPLTGTIWEQLQKASNPEVTGILKTFATAYQSCDVLALKPIVASTPAVSGISIVGDHPAGGKKREISSLANVNATHYYIAHQKLAKNSCFEVRNNPLIYDFGGKPFTSASEPYLLNMFKNGGSGTAVLGIDCSAFVFSSLALSGLKLDPDPKKILKADLVHGVGSGAFKEPQSNGLRCLKKISVNAQDTVRPGDVIAINGHVNIIDSTGKDPFGLANISKLADCAAQVSYQKFDFVIAQSSPSKGGIGINRYSAKDYLAESSTFRNGLTAYALAACRAKFGGSAAVDSPSLSVVRHTHAPDCLTTPLISKNQDCVDSCRAQ